MLDSPSTPPVNPVLIHRLIVLALLVGQVAFGATCLLGRLPLLHDQGQQLQLALGLAGLALAELVVNYMFLKPRAPLRRPEQTPEQYWANPQARAFAIVVWAVYASAGFLGGVGFLLTGSYVPALVSVAALVVLLYQPPAVFSA